MKLTELELTRLRDHKWKRSDYCIEIRARLKKAGLKYCPGCQAVKLFVDFHKGASYCRKCDSARHKKYHAANRETVNERRALYRQFTKDAIDKDAPEPDPTDLLSVDFGDDDDDY